MKIKKTPILLTAVYGICILLLVCCFYVGTTYNIPFEKITGDPANYFQSHPLTGIISNLGALLWCITSSICFYTGFYLKEQTTNKKALFLIYSGLFSFVLLIDDFFMFHDFLFYSINGFYMEPLFYVVYLFFLVRYCIAYYKTILENNYILLGVAVAFLGLSVVLDLVMKSEGLQYFFEDSFKFIGIVSWMLFFTTSSYKILSEKNI
ncbi:MAG: hypothetical protein V3U92_00535 [Cellulophaga sp.]